MYVLLQIQFRGAFSPHYFFFYFFPQEKLHFKIGDIVKEFSQNGILGNSKE